MSNFDVLIVGAGTGGVMAAAQLKNANGKLRIGLIDPADTHWYQPAWTLVGAGTFNYKKTARPMASIIPNGVE
ncbi:MAG: NAD(P)/FAD-dependent oxidoreductase, partial [Flavobacteriia bacterium]|nr:NAD(P)/FAD-dependent oxidoreductase [Flavobacteriia bacterium]